MQRKSAPFSWRNSKEQYKLVRNMKLKGIIESFTIVYSPPEGFEDQTPYIIALVSLGNGHKIVSQIVDVDSENVDVGMSVEPCLRKIYVDGEDGLINYGIKFRLSK